MPHIERRRYDYTVQSIIPLIGSNRAFECFANWREDPIEGRIGVLQSAPMTEWHLFIYRGLSERYKKEPAKFADKEHLLESLKTGRLSDWSNVSLLMFNEQWHKDNPKALYNDEQFEFVDRFMRVFKKCDFYLIRPFIEKMEGTFVTFGLRWSLGMRPDRKILPPLSIRCTMRRLEHFLTTNIETFQHEPTSEAPGLQSGSIPEASGDV